jgi:hypothetical protein
MITSQRNFDADIRNEFKPPRFIWKVAELYQEGKKSRLIDSNWWKKFDKVLEIFDEKFPGSFETHDAGPASPIQSTSNILTASPPPINESRNLPSQTAPSNPQKSKNPIVDYTQAKRTRLPVTTQVKEKEGGVLIPYKSAFKSAPPAPTNKAKPEVEIPLPKTTAPIEIRKTAGKRPPPQRQATPGPSQRPTSQRPTASHEFMESSKSSDSSEEEERIKASQRPTGPGRSKKRPASPQSSSETATEDEEVADKRRKGKGRRTTEDEDGEERHQATAREKKPRKSEKDERDDNGRKIRNLPKATGQLRKKTCSRCDRKELECLVQVGGRACVACAKLKVRCIEVGEEEIPAAKEKPAKKAPAVTFARVIAKKSAPTPTTAPRPEQSAPTPTPAPRPEPVIKSKPRQKTPARPIPPPPPPKKRRQTKKTPKSVETVVNNDGTGSDERPHKKSRTFTELSRGSGKFRLFLFS